MGVVHFFRVVGVFEVDLVRVLLQIAGLGNQRILVKLSLDDHGDGGAFEDAVSSGLRAFGLVDVLTKVDSGHVSALVGIGVRSVHIAIVSDGNGVVLVLDQSDGRTLSRSQLDRFDDGVGGHGQRLAGGVIDRSAFSIWFNRIIVFLICVGVGFAGCLFVQQLQSDPRKQVRQTLAGQLENRNAQIEQLTKDVNAVKAQVDEQSKKVSGKVKSDTLIQDELVIGAVAVTGEGITMTLADPIAASQSDQSTSTRVGTTSKIRVVTDLDLQQLVSLMFQNGAEAISINGNRLGAQTSIRKAGGHILIGVNAIESPYTIEAIGDKNTLAEAMGSKNLASLYDSFKQAGIYPQVNKSNSITLEAAVAGETQYAERNE